MRTMCSTAPHRLFWAIKVLVGLLLVALAFLSPLVDAVPTRVFRVPLWLAQIPALIGPILHGWHYVLLRSRIPHLEQPPALVTSGGLLPWIRHPMYLGDALAMLGFTLFWPTLVSCMLLPIGLLALILQARLEDAELRRRFPQAHRQWSMRAGLLWPNPPTWG